MIYASAYIAPTPEGEKSIQGSQFNFIELLRDKVAKQVHCYSHKHALTKHTYICTTYKDTAIVTFMMTWYYYLDMA